MLDADSTTPNTGQLLHEPACWWGVLVCVVQAALEHGVLNTILSRKTKGFRFFDRFVTFHGSTAAVLRSVVLACCGTVANSKIRLLFIILRSVSNMHDLVKLN